MILQRQRGLNRITFISRASGMLVCCDYDGERVAYELFDEDIEELTIKLLRHVINGDDAIHDDLELPFMPVILPDGGVDREVDEQENQT